jgi:hypothetical protein
MRERGANTDIRQCSTGLLRLVVEALEGPNNAAYHILAEWEASRDGK